MDIKYVGRFSSDSYVGKIANVLSGTVTAHVITILAIPLLARLYDVAEFGVLGVYIACANISRVILCLRYDFAIQSVKSAEDAKALFAFSLWSSVFISGFVVLPLVGFVPFFCERFGSVLWLIALMFLTSSADNVASTWINRIQHFRTYSVSRVVRSGSIVIFQTSLGICFFGENGLILGVFLGEIISVLFLFRQSLRSGAFQLLFSVKSMAASAKASIDNPRYLLPGHALNMTATQAPLLAVDAFFGSQLAGYVHMAQRVVSTPSQLVGAALFRVFFSEASRIYHEHGSCSALTRRTAVLSTVVSLMFLSSVSVFTIFHTDTILGEQWEGAATTILVFAFAEVAPTAFYPISAIWMITNNQKLNLIYQVVRSTMLLTGLGLGLLLGNYFSAIMGYAISRTIAFALFFRKCLSLSEGLVSTKSVRS